MKPPKGGSHELNKGVRRFLLPQDGDPAEGSGDCFFEPRIIRRLGGRSSLPLTVRELLQQLVHPNRAPPHWHWELARQAPKIQRRAFLPRRINHPCKKKNKEPVSLTFNVTKRRQQLLPHLTSPPLLVPFFYPYKKNDNVFLCVCLALVKPQRL